ncbi:hypothetical protein [Chitinophaga sp. sic0106]|uniref:hypothetical protein n=1 Tax=Chitinophaga sp. sic0106 TaxID=2854785 RepID=UPI001C44B137|nr:hypothetical protein [Chitinophaga sp. sic0106]MBV7529781.1 hypothetical protein [Chitinophaga sp. sic0106]
MSDNKKSINKDKIPAFIITDEDARLRRDIYRSDIEKLELFVEMIRRNNLFKTAKITHKKA